MKTTRNLSLILSFLLAMVLVSCDKNEDSNSQPQAENNVKSGNWKITKMIDSGDDETSDFNGYTFTFQNGGIISATNGVKNYAGTWQVSDSNSDDDSPEDLHLIINFSVSDDDDFDDLSEDWNYISNSSSKIELIHVSGGNGGTDYLTFEKIN